MSFFEKNWWIHNEIEEELNELAEYAISYLSLNLFVRGEKPLFFCSHKTWEELYNQTGFVHSDPCVKEICSSFQQILPWMHLPDNKVMISRRTLCAIKEGISLYARLDENTQIVVSLASAREDSIFSLLSSPEGLGILLDVRQKWISKLSQF